MKNRVLKSISSVLAALCLTVVIFAALILEPAVAIYGFSRLDKERLSDIKNTLIIYGDNGKTQNHTFYTPIAQVPKHTVDAFLCAEDKRFFDHEGVDYYRIAYAILKDIKDGAFTQGASTITQQLIKNTHLSGEKSIKRKIQEIRLSKAIERSYTKSQILEMYLNILYFGNSTYGIGNAAENFFGKDVKALSIRESAMLAAIINNPSRFSPYTNAENLQKRTSLILSSMKKGGYITETEFNAALNENVKLQQISLSDKYNCFVISEACKILGCTEEYLLHSDIKIYCACDSSLQKKLASYLAPYDVAAEIIVLDNKSGQIIAHEAKYRGDPSSIVRSPGSTIKPIVSYAPAIEKNIIVPITPILDQKTNFDEYSPNNYKNKYYGWVSCAFALKESLNVPAVKLLDYVGIDYAKKFASDMGINTTDEEGLALALGGMKYGTNLQSIAEAYSIFARGGTKVPSGYIKAIYQGDKLLYYHPTARLRIMKEETAYMINEMLGECIKSGTAKLLDCDPKIWAAKTGTVGGSGDINSDAYCIAYSSDYTIGVHIMDSTASGGGLPTKIAKKLIMSDITCTTPFKMPSSIVKKEINALEYYKNHKIVAAGKGLPKKDRIEASFTKNSLPVSDERTDYEKNSDFFNMDNFTIVDGFFD